MTDLTLPSKTHNNPPSDIEILEDSLTLRHVSLMRAADEHGKLATKIPTQFTDQLEADFVADFIKEIAVLQKSLKAAHKDEKEPFLRQGQLVDSFFNDYIRKLDENIATAKIPLTAWLKKKADEEQVRRDAEAAVLRQNAAIIATSAAPAQVVEAAVQSAALANRAASVPVETMAAAGGKYSKAGLKKEWVGAVTNLAEVDLEKLRAYLKPEALQVALNAFVKMGGRECKGCLIEEQVKVGVR